MRLIGHGRQLRFGQLERIGVFQLVRTGAGRHDLDEIGAGPDLLADRPAHVIGAVGLPVHVAIETAARRGSRDDPAAGQQAGAAERAVAHRLPGLLRRQPLGSGDPDGGDAAAQVRAQVGLQEMRGGPGQGLLGAPQGLRHVPGSMRVRVGQAGHQHPLPGVQQPGAVRAGLGRGADPPDDTVLDQHRGPVTDRAAGAVEQPGAGQPQPPARRGRIGDQRREPVRHARLPSPSPAGCAAHSATVRTAACRGNTFPVSTRCTSGSASRQPSESTTRR